MGSYLSNEILPNEPEKYFTYIKKVQLELSVSIQNPQIHNIYTLNILFKDGIEEKIQCDILDLNQANGNSDVFFKNFSFNHRIEFDQIVIIQIEVNEKKYELETTISRISINKIIQGTLENEKLIIQIKREIPEKFVIIKIETHFEAVNSLYYEISYLGKKLYKSETRKNTLNKTKFKEISIPNKFLFDNEKHFSLVSLEFYNYELKEKIVDYELFINDSGEPLKTTIATNNGKIRSICFIRQDYNLSFLEYILYGLNLSISTYIDFTSSNGNHKQYYSKHNLNNENLYARSLQSIFELLNKYNTNQVVCAYGFGAVPPGNQDILDYFNLNLSDNPSIEGVDNLIKYYKERVNDLKFGGPKNFAPLIKNLMRIDGNKFNSYSISIIITDGNIFDLSETLEQLIDVSNFPVSIFFVGIGKEDFSVLELFNEIPIVDKRSRKSHRKFVNFIPLYNYDDHKALSENIMLRIENQILDYGKFRSLFN